MYDTIIRNATVIDGSGGPGAILDVAVAGDEIAAVGKNSSAKAKIVIEGSGQVLAPGFIDIQNHSDSYWQLFDNPALSSMVAQGFTTLVVGNCGASLAPLINHDALLSVQKWHSLEAANTNWSSFGEYLDELDKKKLGCNIASLVGYSTIRRAITGDQIRALDGHENKALQKILKKSLKEGAFGLSSGLSYSHEIIISELELYDLAKIVAEENGLFSVHLRNEGAEVVEALDEALDIARHTGVNLKISHFKIRGEQNWSRLPEALNLLETAYHQGMNVHFDIYPYSTVWQALYSYLPKWAIEGGRTLMLKHFAEPAQKNKILAYLSNLDIKFPSIIVASTANRLNFAGKTIGQIAKNLDSSSEQAILHLINNGGSEVLVFDRSMDESQVAQLASHPLSFVGTDGGGFGLEIKDRVVHPRCFGTAPKFLKESIASKELPLEVAIGKLTSGPAKKLGLKKRGEICPGFFADMVLFDPVKIRDKSEYQNPFQFPEGINYVFVNGRPALAAGKLTDNLAGRALKKT